MRLISRARRLLKRNRWEWLIALRLNNRRVNASLRPESLESIGNAGIRTGRADLLSADYSRLTRLESLARYRNVGFHHSKVIEYLSSMQLLHCRSGMSLLDSAGGRDAEYMKAVAESVGPIDGFIQDPFADPQKSKPFQVISGSIESIPLPDGSLDAISCHHSLEHFRGELDTRFIQESLRVLKPGGRLVVAPIFITNRYCEIWNSRIGTGDPNALTLLDRSATFGGWGPYEGFARTYDIPAFAERLLAPFDSLCRATVFQVFMDGASVPDLSRNFHQPKLNGDMKVLLIEKLPTTAER